MSSLVDGGQAAACLDQQCTAADARTASCCYTALAELGKYQLVNLILGHLLSRLLLRI